MSEVIPTLPPRVRLLRALLEAAGREALATFAQAGEVRRKHDGSPVTAADEAAERVLLEGIRTHWPEDAARGEEGGRLGGGSGAEWTIDPIDGTSSFIEGLAYWGPTMARLVHDADGRRRVDVGATWLPRLGEYWHVEDDRAWFGDTPLPALGERHVPRVIYVPSDFHRLAGLRWGGKARCLGGTAAHLALVARGAARAAIVGPGWSPWDAAVGLALIKAVGGSAFRIPDGAPIDLHADTGVAFAAGLPDLAAELATGGRVVALSRRDD